MLGANMKDSDTVTGLELAMIILIVIIAITAITSFVVRSNDIVQHIQSSIQTDV